MLQEHLRVLLISMVPILEMKAGIPAGVGMGLDIYTATILGIVGTCLQIPLNLLLIVLLVKFADRFPLGRRFLDWSHRRTEKHRDSIARWGVFGLAVLVGIPIPGTGLWSGTVAGQLMGLSLWRITAALIIGTVIAGVLVALTVAGVTTVFF